MTPRRYQILVASMWLPHPPNLWFRRFELTRRLAADCEITLFGRLVAGGNSSHIEELRSLGVEIHGVAAEDAHEQAVRSRTGWPARWSTLRYTLGTTKPSQVYWNDASTPEGPAALRRLVAGRTFDIIHVEMPIAHWLRGVCVSAPLVVDFDGLNSELLRREADLQSTLPRRILGHIGSYKLRRYEYLAARQANVCVTTSSVDDTILRSMVLNATTCRVPNGVDTAYFSPSARRRDDGRTLLFTGSMGYMPNVDAILYFVRDIWPLIRRTRPDARLQVVGSSPAPEVWALADDPAIEIVGTTPDVRPYFEAAAVVVVPLRIAAGTRVKILQSLAMGKAVVSTTVGAEGLEIGPDEYVRADAPVEFSTAVLDLLAHPDKREQLGIAGRHRVVAHYDWDAAAARLYGLYGDLVTHHIPSNAAPGRRAQACNPIVDRSARDIG